MDINKPAEKLIHHLQENGGDVGIVDIPLEFTKDEEVFRKVKTQLIQQNYLTLHGDNYNRYALKEKGRKFTAYSDQDKLEERQREVEDKIKELTLANYKTQRVIVWVALGISILSAI